MKRRLAKGAIILGLAVLLGDAVLAYLKMETELKFVDVTSGNPRWVRPVATRFDEFVLSVPLGQLLIREWCCWPLDAPEQSTGTRTGQIPTSTEEIMTLK
jgi:hypothetical protein